MKKPWWERTLVHGRRGHEMRVMDAEGAGNPIRERHVAMVYTPSRHDGDGILTWDDADRAAEAIGRGLAAAPDMARALLALFGEAAHTSFCPALVRDSRRCHPDCAAARSALTKAGVPLP